MPEPLPATDASRALLDQAHRWLGAGPLHAPELLADLAAAAGARAAGLVSYPGGQPAFRHPTWPVPVSWLTNPGWAAHAAASASAVVLERDGAGPDLVTRVSAGTDVWLLWVEPAEGRAAWTDAEAAALTLAGQAMGRVLEQPAGRPRWADQVDLMARKQRLETAAAVTRRLAHDFGNVLTGILGFTELALAQQLPANASLHGYLTEVYRAALSGATFTNQLRQFSGRQPLSSRSSDLAAVLAGLEAKAGPDRQAGRLFRLDVSDGLPPVAIEAEPLTTVLTALVDNSREALVGPGAISVTARAVDLSAADCGGYYGDARPGPHAEVTVADTGSGLSPEAMQRLFVEPFFSTKIRRRGGFGLAVAYGILSAHKGGVRLFPGEERGVVAQFVVPVAASLSTPEVPEAGARAGGQGERLLVVDGDDEVLSFVVTSLLRAGFKPTGYRNPADALHAYFANGPYALVVADLGGTPVGGAELARRVLKRDPSARVVFLGERGASAPQEGGRPVDVLIKPFRPEQLVKAVRTALDRPRRPGPVAAARS